MRAPLSRPGEGSAAVAGSVVAHHVEPADAARAGPTPWYFRPVTQGIVAVLLYTGAWLATVGQHMLHQVGDAHLDQLSMDPNFYTWALQWWPYAVGHGLNPFYSHLIWAPHGSSLAWVTTVPPISLLAAPLTVAVGPIVAFNVLATLALPLSAWAAFVLCRRLTRKFWPALVGGAVFGFSAYQMNHIAAGQLNLTYSLLIPLLAYLVVLWHEKAISSRAFVVMAGLTMAVQFYLFLETFADLTALLAVGVVVGLVVAGRAHRAEVLRIAKPLACAYGVALLLALPYLAYALNSRTPKLQADTSLDLLSLVIPRPDRIAPDTWLHRLADGPVAVSAAGYVGLPLLALAVLLIVSGWSRRFVRFLSCMLVVIVLASLGPALTFDGGRVIALPWFWLWRLPIVRNAYPSRLMLFAFLALAVMTALWLASSSSRLWLRVPLAALILIAIYQDVATITVAPHSTVPKFIAKGTYRRQLSPNETVVVVSRIGNAGMLWQADTNFYLRLAGGYLNQSITRRSDLPRAVQDLAHATPATVARFESWVKKDNIGAVLLDGNHEPKWVGIFWRMGLQGHRLGNVVVYKLDHCRSCRPLSSSDIEHGGDRTTQGPASTQ
jgi:hypothetical protein